MLTQARKKPKVINESENCNTCMVRCVNIDWLELFCLEDELTFPHDPNYFRAQGFRVVEREYGTPVYKQMFTLYDVREQPLIEIRRSPKSQRGVQKYGVLDPMACHVRLHNRSCYFNDPAGFIQEFIEQYGLSYQRISRLDICYDFELFDSKDDPQVFLQRYMSGVYAKINQANISAHGRDFWDGRSWNSISWGQEKSMIGTKFYNKTLELRERHDKPYIRQAWRAAGLIDDEIELTKQKPDGTVYKPEIWRVEFSIKSGTRNWFRMEDFKGRKKRIESVMHNLSMYRTKQQQWNIFLSLADHYFHFKHVERLDNGNLQRKDRCSDKVLFNTKEQTQFYKLENIATKDAHDKHLDRLLVILQRYRQEHKMPQVKRACDILIADIMQRQRTSELVHPWPADELAAIRFLIGQRIKGYCKETTIEDVKALYKLGELF